ncbi:cadherin-like and PC-esterase domain-containing protein 1 isoform X1 [Lytechinus variegatus]|uniref:cadherin-like and PC-esterase domain-containing protein 1 isoform X1 n=1 Tax=Lytechinus variegatus TaxID=7654 RepID=UPI001BB1F20C|nr:cadherin-like and PC-esterase domain-containing protein 1 isoform X1 [Lytechinus variegatus]XP_041457827.1 cadherin-like and PC-esterase domain-containing protein 1 isoform X1 [Lytechinus variegatus]XP_041457828.1 cadherin-like and PC-esterase domain-containing protein 1 isoform X1 [Lytechinus variegatus]XP_041457829.1 cadherin-like and PC-esterase domain-containing protein 1 isoform X1 [Lytechinus variegatus]XP_041457830.1 cadherin-like and PC-esterase domain-containing protein 1 isoform X1
MTWHYIMRLLRQRLRDLLFLISAILVLFLYLSCQNTSIENREGSDSLMINDVKSVPAENHGGNGNRVEGYRNILEGIDFQDEDVAIWGKENDKPLEEGTGDKIADERSPLLLHLHEIEDSRDLRFQDAAKVAVVRGEDDVIKRDLPFYKDALEKEGFNIILQEDEDDTKVLEEMKTNANSGDKDWEGWMILLCLSLGEADETGCLQRSSLSKLDKHQKLSVFLQKREFLINRIPGMKDVLWRKDAFCYTTNEARKIPSVRRSDVAPMCWVLPAQFDEFMMTADAMGSDVRWVFKPTKGGIQVLQPTRDKDYERIKQYRSERAVVQQYIPNPLLIFGSPINIRAYVLVTSINPLRAYIHSQGLVFFRHDYQKGFSKIPSRTWSLSQFRQYLLQSYGSEVAYTAFQNLETVITETLLVSEPSLVTDFSQFFHPWEQPYRCSHCFQLLGFDIIFNSTFHPIIIEVTGQPHLQFSDADQQWNSNIIKQTTVDESISLLFSTKRVARHVSDVLDKLDIGIQRFGCNKTKFCLTDGDLDFLLISRREQLSMGSFKPLYPSADIWKYNHLIQEIEHLKSSHIRQDDTLSPPPPITHSTRELHPILVAMETIYHQEDREGLDELRDDSGILVKNIHGLDQRRSEMKGPRCSEDPSTMHLLSSIRTWPFLNMTFDPQQTEYYIEVAYDQIVIQIGAYAMSCDCEARLEDKYGVARPVNFTVGLGKNRISIFVVDITHSTPWVLGEYTLYIQRHHYRTNLISLDVEDRQAVCTLVQDCDLSYLSHHKCGLRLLVDVSWSEVVTKATGLPFCTSGSAPGQWLVPCEKCSDERSCDWDKAKWQPHDCQHREFSQSEVKQCLAGKKLLFIGDSTNRGIMYYLMERMNSSLYQWDKTHDTKLYTDLNDKQTSASFSYYPQFWLPVNERPVFEKTFNHLLRIAGPLSNDSNTVLIVGGVHWMAIHHLTVIQDVLHRSGLIGIKKLVKSLGAGFHQPVDGIHCLTLAEQRKVLLHNQGLQQAAFRMGYSFIDTFNMTMARYKDFLEGKCACHFHKVEEIDIQKSQEHPDLEKVEGHGMTGRYHVTGHINAIYSEILLAQICEVG